MVTMVRITERLAVKVSPRAQETAFEGWFLHQFRSVLRVRVHAVPEGGAANEALRRFLAKALRISLSQVCLISGGRSQLKVFELSDLEEETWKHFLEATGYGKNP